MQKEFTFYKNYREEEKLREAFFQFTPKALYGADFRLWYQLGFWENSYIPYSFFKNEIMVSNASVCEMRIILNGQEFDAVQLATVELYRNISVRVFLANSSKVSICFNLKLAVFLIFYIFFYLYVRIISNDRVSLSWNLQFQF
ncbi:hypothetical protein LEP1GSC082_1083 [Leptospira kirschneri str. H2]|uniref:Uncharacterized protein n=2 Tax=Leptospira kirschneri TaxID=29507 RepID=A0A0E2B6H3_9LEPT|nr:hypothetical protein LEP1GSC081_2749 [Leptospira kirschneri str. H1]EKO62851.1 hypothetical protein LEP1GSC082_1083 [Leptospira kirschneri str. H2]EMK26062.1 hypothetical protein LEP1GSC008_3619 [Leptospira kirschneri serovar Bulgarica str. Nikolaevo]